jgi:replication factor C subunit 1
LRDRADRFRYNKTDHPIAFHKGDMFAASKRKIADAGPVADNEEVVEVSLIYVLS